MPCLCATDKCINLITCFSIFYYFVNLDCKVATVILAGESKKKSSSSDRLCMENGF